MAEEMETTRKEKTQVLQDLSQEIHSGEPGTPVHSTSLRGKTVRTDKAINAVSPQGPRQTDFQSNSLPYLFLFITGI